MVSGLNPLRFGASILTRDLVDGIIRAVGSQSPSIRGIDSDFSDDRPLRGWWF